MKIGKWIGITSAVFVGVLSAGLAVRYIDFTVLSNVLHRAKAQISHDLKSAVHTPTPKYKKVWVPGRPLEQCQADPAVFDSTTARCRFGYWRITRVYFD